MKKTYRFFDYELDLSRIVAFAKDYVDVYARIGEDGNRVYYEMKVLFVECTDLYTFKTPLEAEELLKGKITSHRYIDTSKNSDEYNGKYKLSDLVASVRIMPQVEKFKEAWRAVVNEIK